MAVSPESSPSIDRVEHKPAARALLIAVGFLIGLSGAGLAMLMGWALMHARTPELIAVGVGTVGLFSVIAVYGGHLVRRGLRGWSRVGEFAHASRRYEPLITTASSFIVLGFGVVVWISSGGRPGSWWWYFAVGLTLIPLGGAIHELGHLLVGLAQGRKFGEMWIWPFRAIRSRSASLPPMPAWLPEVDRLGYVRWLDTGEDCAPAADLLMIAAGPAANLVAGGLLLMATGRGEADGVLLPLLRAAGFVNVLLGALNLTEWRVGSDRWRILQILRPGYRSHQFLMRLLVRALDTRPRDWGVTSRQLTDEAAPDPAEGGWLRLLALGVAIDRDDRAEIDRIFALHAQEPVGPPEVLREFSLQRALLGALRDGDAIAARAAIQRAPSVDAGYSDLAEAAVRLAERHVPESRVLLERWRLSAQSHPGWIAGNQWAVERLEAALGTSERA